NIFVSSKLKEKSKDLNGIVLPCGVDFSVFKPIEKVDARAKLNFDLEKKYILFSSSFDIKEKNYPLAMAALRHLQEENIELIELKDYSREEVCLLLNAVDLALMTSSSEGSPQFIKEALACHCPIVSTDVGDVKSLISNNESCFLTSFDAIDVSEKIKLALQVERTESLGFCLSFDNEIIAKKLKEIYQNSLK
ncbi:MAG: glycosyltransferase, partial [Flavobacteriia bacterium]